MQYNFYQAVLNIHQGNYTAAKKFICKAREFLAPELTALVGYVIRLRFPSNRFSESYSRAYATIVGSQQLSELEEIIEYKKHLEVNDKERIKIKHDLWDRRLSLVEVSFGL